MAVAWVLGIGIALSLGLALFAYRRHILDFWGSLGALLVALIISIFADFFWLLTLLGFLLVTYGITKYEYKLKQERGVAEGTSGERGAKNVISNGLLPTLIAGFSGMLGEWAPVLFLCSIAVSAADSFASEIGVLSESKPRLIIKPWQKVDTGYDGGVTLLGQGAALVGALIVAISGFLLLPLSELLPGGAPALDPSLAVFLLVVFAGWLGCQLDSLLGATLEQKGWMNKETVNFSSAAGLAAAATLILLLNAVVVAAAIMGVIVVGTIGGLIWALQYA